jgi:hypothetical protein
MMNSWDELKKHCMDVGYELIILNETAFKIEISPSFYIKCTVKTKWNTLFCEIDICGFEKKCQLIDLILDFIEKKAINEKIAVLSFKTGYSSDKVFYSNRGLQEMSQVVHVDKWRNIFKKDRYDYYFLKILDGDRWNSINAISKKIKKVLKEVAKKFPTLVLFLPCEGYRYTEIGYDYQGQKGNIHFNLEDEKMSIYESESKANIEMDSFTELESKLALIIEGIKKNKRLENLFQPPKFHFSACVFKYVTTNEQIQDYIYNALCRECSPEELEERLVKYAVTFSYGIPFSSIQCVEILNTYFVCRYLPSVETRDFKTKEEALVIFEKWGMEAARSIIEDIKIRMLT